MCFKKAVGLMALAVCAARGPAEPILVDKLAGVVNGEVITYSEVNLAIEIYPVFRQPDESEEDFRIRVLDQLLDYRIVALEYRSETELSAEDYEEVQRAIIGKIGSLDALMRRLEHYGMDWQSFKQFIRDKVIYEKVIREKFQMRITVQYREIEAFYRQEYLPAQKQLNLQERSLVEMAPLIEKHLKKKKSRRRISGWLEEIKSRYQTHNILRSTSGSYRLVPPSGDTDESV